LREIVYAPYWVPAQISDPQSASFRPSPKAEFIQRQRKIVIYDFPNSALFFQILFHEIGHFVFFLVISSVVKKRWVTEIYPGSQCATSYGTLSAAEDFAETYACYARDPELLIRQVPDKFAFMRDYVFSGAPETLKEAGE
jgi:hypothetical protein